MELHDILFFGSLGLLVIFSSIRKYYLSYCNYQTNNYQFKDTVKDLFLNIYILLTPILLGAFYGYLRYIRKVNVINTVIIALALVVYFSLSINVKRQTPKVRLDRTIKSLIVIDLVILIVITTLFTVFFNSPGLFLGPLAFAGLQEVLFILKYPIVMLIKVIFSRLIITKISKSQTEVICFESDYSKVLSKLFEMLSTKAIKSKIITLSPNEYSYLAKFDINFENIDYLLVEIGQYKPNLLKYFKEKPKVVKHLDVLSLSNLDYSYKNIKVDSIFYETALVTPQKKHLINLNIGDELSYSLILNVIKIFDELNINYDLTNLKPIATFASITNPDDIYIINASGYNTKEAYFSHLKMLDNYQFPKILITSADLEYIESKMLFDLKKFIKVYVIDSKYHNLSKKNYQEFEDLNFIIKKELSEAIEEVNNSSIYRKPIIVLIENVLI